MDLYAKAKTSESMTEYIDGQGHRRVTDAAALKAILDALPPQSPRRLLDAAGRRPDRSSRRTGLSDAASFPLRWKIMAGA